MKRTQKLPHRVGRKNHKPISLAMLMLQIDLRVKFILSRQRLHPRGTLFHLIHSDIPLLMRALRGAINGLELSHGSMDVEGICDVEDADNRCPACKALNYIHSVLNTLEET